MTVANSDAASLRKHRSGEHLARRRDHTDLRNGIVIVSHDASRTGAPLTALNVARELREAHGFPVVTILLGPGELQPEFARLGPVFAAPLDPAALHRLDLASYLGPYASGQCARWAGYAIRIIASLWQPYYSWFWRRVIRYLAKRGIRHAICNTVLSGPAAVRLKQAGLTSVGLVHELPHSIRAGNWAEQATALVHGADTLLFACMAVRKAFGDAFAIADKPNIVLPQGFNIDPTRLTAERRAEIRAALRARLGLARDDILVLGCGSGDFHKGIDLFVQTAREIALAPPPSTPRRIVLAWAGTVARGFRVWAEKDAMELNMVDRLIFLGPQQDMVPCYAAADIFFLPSREDSFPNVVLEAMASGLPVVGFASSGGFEDQARAGGGITVPYGDVAAVVKVLCQLAEDPGERNKMGHHGREWIARLGGYERYVSGLVEALQLCF